MSRWTQPLALLLGLSVLPGVMAQSAAPKLEVPLPTSSLKDMSKLLKDVVVATLPPVVRHEDSKNWGQQASVPRMQGLKMVRVMRNHGNWQRWQAFTGPLAKQLELTIHDLRIVDGERFKCRLSLALPTTAEYEQQTWQNGLRLFSSSARARLRVKLDLALETSIKLDNKGEILPDVLIDFKVADAKVSYDNFVLESVLGVGGDAARLAGEAGRVALKRWLPSVERHALEKGREAILKAGKNREFRINLAKLLVKDKSTK